MLLRHVAPPAVMFVVGAFWILVDPFKIGQITDKYSSWIFNAAFHRYIYSSKHQDDIVVVLVQDDTLEYYNQSWPLPYHFHAWALNRIREYKPRAVFVDFLFWDERPDRSLDRLKASLEAYDGVPVYLAAAEPSDERPLGVRNDLAAAARLVQVPRSLNVIQRDRYRFEDADLGERMPPDNRRTAAYAIYRDLCRTDDGGSAVAERALCAAPLVQEPPRAEAFEIVWSGTPHACNRRLVDRRQCTDSSPWQTIRSAFSDGLASVRNACPYTPTILLEELLARPPYDPLDKADCPVGVRTLIEDKVVLYGALLEGIPDVISTPTQTSLAGIYFHAMALDNLFVLGDRYKSDVANLGAYKITGKEISVFYLFLTMALYYFMKHRADRLQGGRRTTLVFYCFWIAVQLGMIFTLAWLAFALMNLAIVDWIGLLFVGVYLPSITERAIDALFPLAAAEASG